MKQIHFLTEAELKQRLDRKTFESLFETSHPDEFVLKEFYDQVKVWAQELDAKYWIEFPDSIFETSASKKSAYRSISRFSDFYPSASRVPSKIFPAYVWRKSVYFPFASNELSIPSKIATIEEKIEFVGKKGNTSVFRLEFQILSTKPLDLKKISELPIPENFTERIVERQGEFFLITPKLNGVQSLFAIRILSDLSEKIEFNFCKLRIDLSENPEAIPVWFSRSGLILSAIDFENSPLYTKNTNEDVSTLEISIPPWLSPSFYFGAGILPFGCLGKLEYVFFGYENSEFLSSIRKKRILEKFDGTQIRFPRIKIFGRRGILLSFPSSKRIRNRQKRSRFRFRKSKKIWKNLKFRIF